MYAQCKATYGDQLNHTDSRHVSDSVAAFLAAGVEQPGEAVSSLGSTLAIDLLSTSPIDAAQYGICSYRWKNLWIVGTDVQPFPLSVTSTMLARFMQCNCMPLTSITACNHVVSAYMLPHCLFVIACGLPGGVTAADGGSNTGGAVLKQFFSADQLQLLSKQIDPAVSSGSSCFCKHDAAWCSLLSHVSTASRAACIAAMPCLPPCMAILPCLLLTPHS